MNFSLFMICAIGYSGTFNIFKQGMKRDFLRNANEIQHMWLQEEINICPYSEYCPKSRTALFVSPNHFSISMQRKTYASMRKYKKRNMPQPIQNCE